MRRGVQAPTRRPRDRVKIKLIGRAVRYWVDKNVKFKNGRVVEIELW